ncbi:MAG: SufD family Fe-S cluster assembly protein [Candidatus Micrarchaeia archaeon]
MDDKDIISLSKELNEPKWLLQERLKSYKVFTVLSAGKPQSESPATSAKISAKCVGIRKDSLHDFLEDKNRKDIAKNIFMNRYFQPEHSIQAAFANAFFNECNFFGSEDGGKAGKEERKGKIELRSNGGISLNFFMPPESYSLEISSTCSGSHLFEHYISESSSCTFNSSILGSPSGDSNSSSEVCALLFGKKASYRETSLISLSSSQQAYAGRYCIHISPETISNISVRGVVRDSAKATVDGLVKIEKGAVESDSNISAHVLLLDAGARARADPKMEILNNDVSAKHSASVGEIDSEHIFYLMSRGMGEKEAKETIVEGFLGKL